MGTALLRTPHLALPQPCASSVFSTWLEARRLSGALEIAHFLELDRSVFKSWLCPQP